MAIVVYTPIFTLQRVEVSGTSYLTKEQICEIGRIHTGEPLFQPADRCRGTESHA